MTARQKLLLPGHRVSIRNHPSGQTAIQDATIYLSPGDTLAVTTPGVVVPPPVTGIPPMPGGFDLLAKDFGVTQTLAPFRRVTYVDDHPGDLMGWANDYGKNAAGQSAPADLVRFEKDGDRFFLRQECRPQTTSPTSKWWATHLSTGDDGHGGKPTFGFDIAYIECAFRLLNPSPHNWSTPLWTVDATPPWGADELDIEVLENGKLNFRVLPQKIQPGSVPFPVGWHRAGIAIADHWVRFTFDGVAVGPRVTVERATMNILSDAKLGFPWSPSSTNPKWPNPATTPHPIVDLGWVGASSVIPASL